MSIISYTVKVGDTLSQIAKDQETTVAAFMAVNPEITDPDRIQIGQVLVLPSEAKGYEIFEGVEGYETGKSVHMVEISEGSDGTQWGIGQDARVYKKENGSWKQNPSGIAAHIVVLDANNVYVSNSNGEVYKLKGSAYNSEWEKNQDARNVIYLNRSPDWTTIEVSNEHGDLYQLENGKWKLLFSERHPGADQPMKTYSERRIEFAAGATAATVENTVVAGSWDRYTLWVQAGQTMQLDLSSTDNNATFLVEAPGGQLLTGGTGGSVLDQWEGQLPATGDYAIVVRPTLGDARYRLVVTLPPLTAERETGWIQFAPGATSATYSGSLLTSGHGDRYLFRAAAGQTVTIDFAPAGLLTVSLMTADGSYFENTKGRLEAVLPEAGEHTLDVIATNAENGVQYQFTITIE